MIAARNQFRMQKRVGFILFAAGLLGAAFSISRVIQGKYPLRINSDPIIAASIHTTAAILALATSRIDKPIFRFVQVFVVFGLGLAGFSAAERYVGMTAIVFSVLLAIQYAYFKKHFVSKVVVALVLIFAVPFVGAIGQGSFDVVDDLTSFAFAVGVLLLLWIIFAEEIREYMTTTKELVEERGKSAVYVKFGKNVAGLVHNLRNVLGMLYPINSLVASAKDETERGKWLKRERDVFDSMDTMIGHMLAVVKATQRTETDTIDTNELIEALSVLFQTNPEFKKKVQLEIDTCDPPLEIQARPLILSQVIENLVANSWDAFHDSGRGGEEAEPVDWRITIKTFRTPRNGISIADNGSGVPGLTYCRNDECRRFFTVGRTSKERGTGLGVPFILDAAADSGWEITFESERNRGTTVTILF